MKFLLIALLAVLPGCRHVCAKTWETGTAVSHSTHWGDAVEQHVTIGGELGESCKDSE